MKAAFGTSVPTSWLSAGTKPGGGVTWYHVPKHIEHSFENDNGGPAGLFLEIWEIGRLLTGGSFATKADRWNAIQEVPPSPPTTTENVMQNLLKIYLRH